MTLPKSTRCVKVYVSEVTLDALRTVANEQGCSLSLLLLNAAIQVYLGGRSNDSTRLATLERKLRSLETSVEQRVTNVEPIPTQKRVQVDLFPQTFKQSSEPVIRSSHEQIGLDKLVERLGGTSSLKARLCQAGGRDGKLFKGDLTKAGNVERQTTALDPDGLSWLPLTENRLTWIQISAEEFCRLIINNRKEL